MLDPDASGLLPGPYWFYVLPRTGVIVGFEARCEPSSPTPLRETRQQAAHYRDHLIEQQQLSLGDLDLLRSGRPHGAALLALQSDIRSRVNWLAFGLFAALLGGIGAGLGTDLLWGVGFVAWFGVWLQTARACAYPTTSTSTWSIGRSTACSGSPVPIAWRQPSTNPELGR